MNNSNFPCKDCEFEFPTAKAFVNHIPNCVPYNSDASLYLQNAALFLRDWVKATRTLTKKFTKTGKWIHPLEKLEKNTLAWLVANKLQGDL